MSYDWSPDGNCIAFAAVPDDLQTDIYVSNWDGSNTQNITHSPAKENYPKWSPDGRSIGFESCDDTGCSLVRTNSDGSGRELLLQHVKGANKPGSPMGLNWSPDGQTIIFAAMSSSGYFEQIFVSDLAGTHITQLTSESVEHLSLSYSHTGDFIAYVREEDQGLVTLNDIFTMRSDGSSPTNLTRGALGLQRDTSWSPHDEWLAFSSRNRTEPAGAYNVYVIRPDGTQLLEVTRTVYVDDYAPAWRVTTGP